MVLLTYLFFGQEAKSFFRGDAIYLTDNGEVQTFRFASSRPLAMPPIGSREWVVANINASGKQFAIYQLGGMNDGLDNRLTLLSISPIGAKPCFARDFKEGYMDAMEWDGDRLVYWAPQDYKQYDRDEAHLVVRTKRKTIRKVRPKWETTIPTKVVKWIQKKFDGPMEMAYLLPPNTKYYVSPLQRFEVDQAPPGPNFISVQGDRAVLSYRGQLTLVQFQNGKASELAISGNFGRCALDGNYVFVLSRGEKPSIRKFNLKLQRVNEVSVPDLQDFWLVNP